MLAVPLVLLVVFVLWAGRGGRAGLVSDLAAGEAAVVASLCCEDGADPDAAAERERVVADVLSARPGLGFLCIGGPRPRDMTPGEEGFVDEAWLENFDPEVPGATRGVGAVGVRFECETDGAVAPLRGLFPTVSFFGQAAEVVAIPPSPELKVGEGRVQEGDDPANPKMMEFLVELTGPAAQDVVIVYWTDDNWTSDDPDPPPNTDKAAAGDYTAIPKPNPPTVPERIATIAAGQVSAVVKVDITGDVVYERDETFLLRWFMRPSDSCAADVPQLQDPAAGNNPPNIACQGDPQMPIDANFNPADYWTGQPAVGIIEKDDPAPTLVVNPASAEEGEQMTFVVSLQGPTEVAVEVTVETRDQGTGVGKATSGVDYTPIDSTSPNRAITFPTGTTSRTVTVSTIENTIGEQDKTFELTATAEGHARTNPPNIESGKHVAIGVGTILDDEPKISIEVGAGTSVEEGNPLEVEVKLNPPPTGDPVTVHYKIGPSGANPATPPGMPNNDYSVRSRPTTDELTFNTGETVETIWVDTVDDDLNENDETFTVELERPSTNSLIVVSSVVVTIKNDDPKPEFKIDGPAGTVDEGQKAVFTAKLNEPSSFPVKFNVETRDDTAKTTSPHNDYETLSRQMTIPAGETELDIEVQTLSDGHVEGEEEFHLDVRNLLSAVPDPNDPDALTASATIRNVNRDVRVSDAPEAGEGEKLVFTITLVDGNTDHIANPVDINFEVVELNTGCPCAIGDDYSYDGPGYVTFQPGELTHTVEVDALLDTNPTEGNEKLALRLVSLPSEFGTSKRQGTGTIVDFDAPTLNVVNNPTKKEEETLEFEIKQDKVSARETTFDVYTHALTASAGADYPNTNEGLSNTSTHTIPAGSTAAVTVQVPALRDDYLEPDEQFQLRIAEAQNALIGDGIGTGTIEDVLPMWVSVGDADAVAGDEVGFEVGLSRPAAAAFTVFYWTSQNSALASPQGGGLDYDNANEGVGNEGTVNFFVGDRRKIAEVETWPDGDLNNEEFWLYIALDQRAIDAGIRLGDFTAVGTIKPRYSLLEVANAGAQEDDPVEFTVTRRGRTDQRSEVGWFTQDLATAARPAESGSACGNACDYTAASGALVFEAGDTEQTISVATREDQLDEWPNEQFAVRLHSPVNAGLGASAAVGTINEECVDPAVPDSAQPTVTGVDQKVSEGAGQATVVFRVFPAVCPASPATANYATGPPTGAGYTAATAGADYTDARGTAQVEGNRIVFDVAVLDDALDEDDEAFEVAIGSWTVPARWTATATATATIIIEDDDNLPSVSVYEASAVEGQDVRFSVRLDRPSGRTVRVSYHTQTKSTAASKAQAGSDYTEIPQSSPVELVFDPGDTEKFADVTTRTDGDGREGDEEFLVVLVNPDGASVAGRTATGTIVDRTKPGLSIESNYEDTGTKASEDNEEVFTVTLDYPSTDPVTVDYETVALSGDGAATSGDDYLHVSGTLTFAANETSKEFSVDILEDNVPEGDERLLARLLNPDNAVIGDGVAATVIAGQCADPANAAHPPPGLSVAGASIDEGHPSGTMAFALTTDRPLCSETAISVSLTHTTTSAADFARTPAAAVFPAGVTSAVYQGIVVADDDLDEEDETFGVAVSWAAGPSSWQTAAAATATGTIIDDDDKAAISIAAASGPEGATLSFPVTLDRVTQQPVEVDYEAIKNNRPGAQPAEPGDDFTAVPGRLTIPAGAISGAIEVPALRDEDDGEPDETFLVQLSNTSSHAKISVATAVGTITDVPTPKVSVSNAEADEGQILEFQVALDTEGAEPVKVEYRTIERSGARAATSGDDYLHVSGTLTFAPGETLKTVLVAALADDEPGEGDESLLLRLSNPAGADLGDPIGIGVIHNLGEPDISVADSRAEEGRSVVFEITLSNRANQDITVGYATESRRTAGDVAATPGDDYNAVSGTAIIAAGDTEATVAVATVDDRLDEYDEVFPLNLTLKDGDYGTLDDASATGTIEDNDGEPLISVADTAAAEDAGTLAVAVSLDAPSGRTVAVDYAISPGTATEGADYEAAEGVPLSGTVAIPAGRVSAALSVALIDDDDAEGAETLTVSLSNPRNATLAASEATLTILDDEGPPTAYLDPDPAGSPEGQPAEIALRLSGPSEQTVTVRYRTRGGTATPGADYTAVADGTATFAPNEVLKTLSTSTVDDDVEEEDETVIWEIHTPTNAQLAQATGASVILDDDGVPRIIVDDARATEGGQAAFTIRLSAPADEQVTVAYRTEADAFAGAAAATPSQDFTDTSGTATIAAGNQTATVQVSLPDDVLDEGAETFWLRLDADTATGADVADAVAIGTIDDNDPVPTLSITDATAAEGDPVQFAVALSAPSGRTVRVRYAPQRDTSAPANREATPVDDYDPTAKTLVIPAGTTTATAEVQAYEDQITEYRETFLVRLYNPGHATITSATATGTIIDKTGLPQATIANAQTAEGSGTMSVPVTLSHSSAQTVTIAYTTQTTGTDEDGHAKPGDDYTTKTGTLTIDPGETTGTIDIAIADDDTVEPDETFAIQLRNPQQATLIEDQATATIIDDDGLPRLSITGAQAAEDDGAITLTVALSHPSTETVTVQYNTFDNTATQRRDYTPTTDTLEIEPGETTAAITVPIIDDLIDENPETITVRLTNPTRATVLRTAAAATATIADDDPAPTIRLLPATAEEGQPLQFTALLDAPSGLTAQAQYATQTTGTGVGHATPRADYTHTRGTITIPPGQTTATIAVTTHTDTRNETPETLQLALTNPQNTTLHPTDHTATGTINNRLVPDLAVKDATALEGDPLVFTMELSQPSDTDVTMSIQMHSISASYGSDFEVSQRNRGRLTIPAGQTSATYSVATFSDNLREDTETMLLILVGVSDNVELLDGIAVGTIFDGQSAGLSVGDASATEGGALTFTVSLERKGDDDSEVTVAYRTRPQTAAEGVDYTAAAGTLVFSSDTSSMPITVQTSQDTLSEASEVFFVELQSPTGAVLHDHLGSGTINDDDPVPVLSIAAAQTDEGTPLVFTATLNSPSGRRITADYRTRADTATSGVDYLPATGTVVFPVGSTSQDISVVTLPDQQEEPDETLEMVLSNVVGAASGASATGTIVDSTVPALKVADASAREGDPLEFVVTLNSQHDTAVTVGYATADATATAASGDYTGASGNLVFEPGDTQKTVSVTTLADTRDEPAETLTLTLSYTGNAIRIIDGSATGTIRSSTLPAISIRDADEIEGRTMAFHVQLSHPPEETATVAYKTVNGTAAAPGDYRSASGTLIFYPGQASRTIRITIRPDSTDEEDRETFFLELSNPTGAVLESPTIRATGTIYDTDRLPQISLSRSGVNEGNVDYEVSINVVRIGTRTSREVTVDWELQGLSILGHDAATAGEDFKAASGTLRFDPSTRILRIPATLIGDRIYENTETIAVVLSNPVNATLANPIGVFIVHDNEPYVLQLIGGSAREGNAVNFIIRSALGRARVEYETVQGTATENDDYIPQKGVVSIGSTHRGGEATISIRTKGDTIAEGVERFTLEISTGADTGIETSSTATGTIVDGTDRVVSVSHPDYSGLIGEGQGNPYFAVYLDSAAETPVTVDYEFIDGTARINYDYRDLSGLSGKVTIPAGSTEAAVRVRAYADGVYEGLETFQMRISNPQGAVIGTSTAMATIESIDSPPRVSVANTSIEEGEDAQFAVRLTRRSERGTRVTYATSDGTAKAGTDYTAQSGTLTFGPTETLKIVSVPTSENSTMEDDRTFNFTLSNPQHADIADGGGSAFGRIIDDDCVDLSAADFAPPTLAIASASANEGDEMSFEVSVSKPFCSDVASAVSVSVALGDASSGDVNTPSGVVGFKAGETKAEFSGVTTFEDSLDEENETVVATASWHPSLNVGAAYSATTVSATGTIVDDDDPPALEVLNATAAEAGELLFIVRLDAPSGKRVTVDYETPRGVGTADTGDDYTAVSGTLTFEPGQTTKQVVVQSLADALDEHDETFQLKLSNPTNATIKDAIAMGTIEDDDPLPVVSIADKAADEDDRRLQLTITLSAVSGRDVTVVYTTADDTDDSDGDNKATAGDDYTAKTAKATISKGNRTTTIEITVAADNTPEPNETFLVKLLTSSPDNTLKTTHATIHADDHTATATITNDD